jgi:hypothetical protein
MGKYQIICSLDYKESAFTLYGEYTDLNKRTFPNEQDAIAVQNDLVKRSTRLLWNAVFPDYQIVPAEE